MSWVEPPGHLGGLDLADRCNTPVLADLLDERDLLGYGPLLDGTLTERDTDRVRIAKFIASKPEGTPLTHIVSYALKGVSPEKCERVDGSDPDYQFAYRFIDDLAAPDDPYVRKSEPSGVLMVTPTLRLLDLISYGITQTPTQSDEIVYDKEFCLNLLKSTRSRLLELPDFAKDVLARSLRRYIQRVRDYRLAFDVHFVDRTGMDQRRMYKPYATRFTDDGRRDKTFAMLQQSLDWGADHSDTAVFCTLTTDPKKFDSLYDAIMAVYENFNALNSYMANDPTTKGDTRKEGVPAWSGPESGTTGRPRERLEYIKVLEFSDKGYPHLHVLYFDPPRREKDGMPWLIDKAELSHYWNKDTSNRTGQGRIVDTYPLVYRDDLDDLDAEFNADEGFVSWYRYGNHDHDEEWVESRVRFHQEEGQIDFDGADENPMQKTAGSYIGKYLSETYAELTDLEAIDTDNWNPDTEGKSTWWKLGLYWCTERRFWSPSRTIRDAIKLDDDRTDVRRGVADATRSSLLRLTEQLHEPHACYPDLDRAKADSLLYRVSRDLVAQMDLDARDAGQTQTTLARVEYLGAYRYDDLPARPETTVRPEVFEKNLADDDCDLELASLGDRPPPIKQAFDGA